MLGGDHLLGVVGWRGVLLSADALDLGDGLRRHDTPRQPRLESSSTAQISESALGLAGEPADDLGASADLDERSLQEVRGPDPLAVLGRPAQVRDERVEGRVR